MPSARRRHPSTRITASSQTEHKAPRRRRSQMTRGSTRGTRPTRGTRTSTSSRSPRTSRRATPRRTGPGWSDSRRLQFRRRRDTVNGVSTQAITIDECEAKCAAHFPSGRGVLACVEIKILRRVLNRRVDLHAIDATPARRRGGVDSSPLDRARTAASSRTRSTG